MALDYDIAIAIAIFLFVAVAFLWFGTWMYRNPSFDPYVNVENASAYRQCLPGQCAVNIYSGVKRCPTNNVNRQNAIVGLEICSSKFLCDNPAAPFAIDDRGLALGGSVCPSGVACQCLPDQYCGDNIMTYFSPFWSSQDVTTKFGQKTTVTDVLGKVHSTPPYLIPQGSGQCTLQPERYASKALDTTSCLFGTMAYFPNSSATVDGLTTPLACVRGKPCGSGYTAVWNNSRDAIDCVNNVRNSVLN